MKKNLFQALMPVLLVLFLSACSEDGDSNKSIELTNGTTTQQTLYADETQKDGCINFTAKEAWQATVTPVTTKANSNVEWLKLSAYSGDAGNFSLTMSIQTNTTGQDRKAEIAIISNSTKISIMVEQKGTKEDGTIPEDPDSTIKGLISSIDYTFFYFDGTTSSFDGKKKYDFTYDENKRLTQIISTEENESSNGSYIREINTMNITYSENKVSYEITKTENGIEVPYKNNGSVMLDSNGRAISGEYTDYEFDDTPYHVEYTLSYNENGELEKSILNDGSEEVEEELLTWTEGNPTKVWWGTADRDMSDWAEYDLAIPNQTNIDLNWIITLCTEGWEFANGDPNNIFSITGLTGKRPLNMVSKTLSSESEDDIVYLYEYQLNDAKMPVKITSSVKKPTINKYKDREYIISYYE